MNWTEHWGLARDPFAAGGGVYVPLPGHEETVARLIYTIEAGNRLALLSAPSGTGQTLVLGRALAAARDPLRRFALASDPIDGAHLYSRLAEKLGARGALSAHRGAAWLALQRALDTCALQGLQVVLVVDDYRSMSDNGAREDLVRLARIGVPAGGRLTVILARNDDCRDRDLLDHSSVLKIHLKPLTGSEAEFYLTTKLAAAGCRDAIFSHRAVSRLHFHSGGIHRGLDHLASLCLIAAYSRGLEAVSSDLVDGVNGEFRHSAEAVI